MNKVSIENNIELPLNWEVDSLLPEDFIDYYHKHKKAIEKVLKTSGALKFTGVDIDSLKTFQIIVNSISSDFLNYVDGNSPRTKLSDNVYTSTEYDNAQKITMHNELSYSAKWPGRLFFSCLQVADEGGETLLADSRDIFRKMNQNIVSEIEAKGITYIRNLHGGNGVGPSWQETFEVESKHELENYFKSNSIDFAWTDTDNLRLMQFSKGIIKHRFTGETVWFNQIDQFHPSHLGADLYEAISSIYESPDNFPMYVRFGNGDTISEDMVAEIINTIDEVTTAPLWSRNELLIIDNELISHGRNPFRGERKVLVAMSS